MAASSMLGAATVDEAARLAALVADIPRSPQLTGWLNDVCVTSRSWTTPDGIVHPSRLAELLTLRELADTSSGFGKTCLTGLQAGQALRAVAFLVRATTDYKEASALLGHVLGNLDERIAGPHDPVRTLTAALSMIPDSANSLAPAAIAVNRKIVDLMPTGRDLAARSYWLEELSYRLSGAGHHDDAVEAARHAVKLCRELAALSPDSHLPGLVLSLENLAQRLHEHKETAAAQAFLAQAVSYGRELVDKDPAVYRPWLARLLTTTARFGNSPDPEQSAAAADEAIALYQQAALATPGLYGDELDRCRKLQSPSAKIRDTIASG